MSASPPPPEAVLIYRARESASITIADAAKAAGITDTRWSQIERGHERRKGIDVPARAKAGTLARMARAVGISPERLEKEGQREDAADLLREMLSTAGGPPRPDVVHIPAPVPGSPSKAARAAFPGDEWKQRLYDIPADTPEEDELKAMFFQALDEARRDLREDRNGSRGDETALHSGHLVLCRKPPARHARHDTGWQLRNFFTPRRACTDSPRGGMLPLPRGECLGGGSKLTMCDNALPAPGAVLAAVDLRLSKIERMVAAALGKPRPGGVYLALMDVTAELRLERLAVESMKVLFGAGRASLAAELAEADEAAREPCQVIRLSG